MSDSCGTCKYRHLYKELVDGKWIKSDCCIVLTRDITYADEYDSFVIKINENDMCEMYELKEHENEV